MLWLMCSHWMRTLPHYCLLWNLEVSKAENVMITWSLSFFQTRRSTTTSYIDPVFLVDMQLYSYCTCYRVCALLNFMHRITDHNIIITITLSHCHHHHTITTSSHYHIITITLSQHHHTITTSSSPSHYHIVTIITLSQHHHHHHTITLYCSLFHYPN